MLDAVGCDVEQNEEALEDVSKTNRASYARFVLNAMLALVAAPPLFLSRATMLSLTPMLTTSNGLLL